MTPQLRAETISRISLLRVPIAPITERETVQIVVDQLVCGRGGWIVTANLDILRQLVQNAETHRLVEGASLIVADGMPVVWASKVSGQPLPERVTGSNLIHSLSTAVADLGYSVYLLGGESGTAEAAAERLQRESPKLRVAGTYCPALGFEHDRSEINKLTGDLVATSPDIVYVALGFPKQEQLIARLRHHLPHAWWIGVGISFSFVSGRIKRAPIWMQRLGIEWVHRLAQEPCRLFPRYIIHDLPFAGRLFSHAAMQRFLRRSMEFKSSTTPEPAGYRPSTGPTSSAPPREGSRS